MFDRVVLITIGAATVALAYLAGSYLAFFVGMVGGMVSAKYVADTVGTDPIGRAVKRWLFFFVGYAVAVAGQVVAT